VTSFKTSIYINIYFFNSKQKIITSLQKLKYDITYYFPNISFVIDENNTKTSISTYDIVVYLFDNKYFSKEYTDIMLDMRNGGLSEHQEVYFFFDLKEINKVSSLKMSRLLNICIKKISFTPNILYDYIVEDYDIRKLFYGSRGNDKIGDLYSEGIEDMNYMDDMNESSTRTSKVNSNKFNLFSYFLMKHYEYNNSNYSIFGNENYISLLLSTESTKQLEDRYFCQVLFNRILDSNSISYRIFRTFKFYVECEIHLLNQKKELLDEFHIKIEEIESVPILISEKSS